MYRRLANCSAAHDLFRLASRVPHTLYLHSVLCRYRQALEDCSAAETLTHQHSVLFPLYHHSVPCRYKQALEDYSAADDLFTQQRSPDRALDARANR
jgi:hypothetical protein